MKRFGLGVLITLVGVAFFALTVVLVPLVFIWFCLVLTLGHLYDARSK